MVYREANDRSLLNCKPGYGTKTPEEAGITGRMVAWLTVEGAGIDLPIMQGDDNNEYLNKDPYGNYSLGGSAFLDCRNSADFSDEYSLIYGHHMDQGAMFGPLDGFAEKDGLEKRGKGSLIIGETEYPLRFFAVLETDSHDPAIFSPPQNMRAVIARAEEKKISSDKNKFPKKGEKIVALSTCRTSDSTARLVVLAAIESENGKPAETERRRSDSED